MRGLFPARLLILPLVIAYPLVARAMPQARSAPLSPVLHLTLAHPEFRDALFAQMVRTGVLPLSGRLMRFQAFPIRPEDSLRRLRSAALVSAKDPAAILQVEAAKVLDGLVHAPPAFLAANREDLAAIFGVVNVPDLEALAASKPESSEGALDLSSARAVEELHARVGGLFEHGRLNFKSARFAIAAPRDATYEGKRVKNIFIGNGVVYVETVKNQLKGEVSLKLGLEAGVKQNGRQYRERNVKVIAQDMRADIKVAVRAGVLPAAKYFVKITWWTGGDALSAINVTVKNASWDQRQRIKTFLEGLNRQYNLMRSIDQDVGWITRSLDFFFGVRFEDSEPREQNL